ncbi:MAG: glycosyltransferase family 4 protein [Kiritimatiellae bacterium]|nr:glycosyltransferase family 4 protein [Kiritimatiellia bacterium]
MRITLDIQSALANRSGVGRYTYELLRHLPQALAPGDSLSAFCFDFHRRASALPVPPSVRIHAVPFPGRVAQALWKRLRFPPFELFAPASDLVHFPAFALPPLASRRSRVVATVHDVSFLRLPETTEPKNLAFLSAVIRPSVARADLILTDSEFSRTEIAETLSVPPDKIRAIPLGLSGDISLDGAVLPPPPVEGPYLLFVGNLEPRKNLPLLIRAFDAVDTPDLSLVLAGGRGWKNEAIFEAMRNAKKANKIRYLQYVTDEVLRSLYAHAAAFVFPSLYEGFGLPPLEAAAAGVPVVCARNSSLPEVLGDAALWVEENRLDAWVEAIEGLLSDSALRARLSAAGKRQAARFTWDETARRTVAAYREAAR